MAPLSKQLLLLAFILPQKPQSCRVSSWKKREMRGHFTSHGRPCERPWPIFICLQQLWLDCKKSYKQVYSALSCQLQNKWKGSRLSLLAKQKSDKRSRWQLWPGEPLYNFNWVCQLHPFLVIHAWVTSQLGYCNVLYMSFPWRLVRSFHWSSVPTHTLSRSKCSFKYYKYLKNKERIKKKIVY